MASNVIFSIETQVEMEGRQLKAIKPNKDGVYTGIPLTVLGTNSRNMVNYDTQSVIQCLTDPKGRFAANIATGDMEGEWGHPFLSGDKTIDRLLHIERTRVSHRIVKVYGKKDDSTGLTMIYGDIKPFGPYGEYLKKSFEDPTQNTSFSLRSAAIKTGVENGITNKRMLALVTFDAVDGPGFLRASKRFRDPEASNENLQIISEESKKLDASIECTKEQFLKTQKSLKDAGVESVVLTDQRVLDAFCCDKVTIVNRAVSRLKGNYFSDGEQVSVFDMCFGV